jgi:opacity protein-like surface antigen
MRRNVIIGSVLMLFALAAVAQEQRSEISVQGLGFFTSDSEGRGIRQEPTNAGGFLLGYRFHVNRWLAADANYGFSRNTQQYFAPAGDFRVQSDVHQATAGLVFRLPFPADVRMNPFLLAGGGVLAFNPTENAGGFVTGADTQTRGVFVYGGGADFPLGSHVALRAEYRGLVYNAPDFELDSLNADTVTHTAQPSVGIVFRF